MEVTVISDTKGGTQSRNLGTDAEAMEEQCFLAQPASLYSLGLPTQGRYLPQGAGPFHTNYELINPENARRLAYRKISWRWFSIEVPSSLATLAVSHQHN